MRRIFVSVLLGITASAAPLIFTEIALGANPKIDDICILDDEGSCKKVFGQGITGLRELVQEKIFFTGKGAAATPQFLMIAFVAIALGMFFFYGVQMIIFSDDENVLTESKTAYFQAITGCAIVAGAVLLTQAFTNQGDKLIDPKIIIGKKGEGGLKDIIEYFKIALGVALAFNIVFQGSRMIALQGQEGEIDKQKKKFFNGLMGVVVVLLADQLIKAVTGDTLQKGGGKSTIIGDEVLGMANFLIEIFGILTVIAFVAAGMLILIAVNPETVEKGKKLMITAIVSSAVVICSYAIVNLFL
ncbi:hypothetical protein A3D11_00260 [Candidatus Peribacteria bacterium RIFCSPHIGHO2_02_FULL_49_16]|nr:MAG: hypothetical protein A2880_02670 [Candidatus Peribacteria bacterium RIFCSPHIGHO2_01_FULL_49_38]OGJ59044.1 MAG: hypothetical protein A3D11_00260 [Candidatus Peribacteria bacterium RIFCSPHIGHO2_02_FULL_49_16]